MKRFILLLLFITLYSCGSSRVNDYAYANGWAFKEMPPSQVKKSPDPFYQGKLSDGRIFSVGGGIFGDDADHYYTVFMQDLGWNRKGDGWEAPYSAIDKKRGHLYINIERGVAIYFYPVEHFNTFKVKVYPKGTILLDPLLNN